MFFKKSIEQNKIMAIDMHCHIIPGVDDGAADIEESMKMFHIAKEQGIMSIIATPHYHVNRGHASVKKIQNQADLLQEAISNENPDFHIYLGNEINHNSEAFEKLRDKQINTMAGSDYILVEFSPGDSFKMIYQALYMYQSEGYFPILAHIERYRSLYGHMDYIEQLHELGIYFQINAGTIAGNNGKESQKFADEIMKRDMLNFVATDAHNALNRKPQIDKAVIRIRKLFGENRVNKYLYENPLNIIKNEVI